MSAHSLIHSKKSIEITHIVNPQLFWFKYKDNSVDKTYAKLEKQFQKYVDDFSKDTYKNDRPIQKDSIVLVYIQEKWIRAKVEEIADQTDENSATVIWAIDHGMLMESVLVYTIPLNDEYLAKHPAINVHIGGLSHIAPAELFLVCFSNLLYLINFNWCLIVSRTLAPKNEVKNGHKMQRTTSGN